MIDLHDQVRPECPHTHDSNTGFNSAVRGTNSCRQGYLENFRLEEEETGQKPTSQDHSYRNAALPCINGAISAPLT